MQCIWQEVVWQEVDPEHHYFVFDSNPGGCLGYFAQLHYLADGGPQRQDFFLKHEIAFGAAKWPMPYKIMDHACGMLVLNWRAHEKLDARTKIRCSLFSYGGLHRVQ